MIYMYIIGENPFSKGFPSIIHANHVYQCNSYLYTSPNRKSRNFFRLFLLFRVVYMKI